MRRTILTCAFAAATLIAGAAGLRGTSRPAEAYANRAGAALQAAPGLTRMEQVVQFYVSNKQLMGSVLVARGDTVLLNKGYGFANLEWDIPNSPSTEFRLGSLTKQFTAASILLLEDRGKLNVDDPVKKHSPAFWSATRRSSCKVRRATLAHNGHQWPFLI
jgi:CubicO group peptidase (beta-lactamase class C family)